MSEDIGEVSWNPLLEKYFSDTGEKAHCLGWLHKRSEELYSRRKTFIDLPVIIGSGVIAFLNAGSSTLWSDPAVSSVALGVGSLLVGTLNTLGTYYGWAKRAEQHRISALQYARLYRFLNVEMTLPRAERMTPRELLKMTKDGIDRLAEISPLIPPNVIADFRRRFDREKEIAKPEEANGLERIVVFPESELLEQNGYRLRLDPPPSSPLPVPPPLPLRKGVSVAGGNQPASVRLDYEQSLGQETAESQPSHPSGLSGEATSSLEPSAKGSAPPNRRQSVSRAP